MKTQDVKDWILWYAMKGYFKTWKLLKRVAAWWQNDSSRKH